MPAPRFPRLRRVLLTTAVAIGAALFFFCWLLPHCVNKKTLGRRLQSWMEAACGETSPASFESIDVALRAHGRADLYLHDVELEAPNPAFPFPWLQVATVRASAPVYELWGGIRAAVAVQLRRPTLRLQWDEAGNGNLDGLELRPRAPLPFKRFSPGDLLLQVMNGKVIVDHPLLDLEAIVNGAAELRTIGRDHLRLQGADAAFRYREVQGQAPRRGSLRMRKGAWHYETAPAAPTFEMEFSGLPLRLANLALPGLPTLPPGATLGGSLTEHAGETEFDGEVAGNALPLLPERFGARLRCAHGGKSQRYDLTLRRLSPGAPAAAPFGGGEDWAFARLTWEIAKGRPGKLRGEFPLLDLRADPRRLAPAWAALLARAFPAAHLEIGRLLFDGFSFQNVAMDVKAGKGGKADVSAECLVAGGKMLVSAGGLPLGGGLPASFRTVLDVPAVGDTLLYFSGLLPPLFSASPLRGKGQAALDYSAPGGGPAALELRLALEGVSIPTLTAGAALQALNDLREGMNEAENMARRAAVTPRPPRPPELAEGPETLEFTSVLARYSVTAGGARRLEGLEAVCPRLGVVTGVGASTPDGAFRLSLVVRKAPAEVLAGLSPDVRAAAEAVMADKGLRLECLATPEGGKVERQYVQDVFRRWLEAAAPAR